MAKLAPLDLRSLARAEETEPAPPAVARPAVALAPEHAPAEAGRGGGSRPNGEAGELGELARRSPRLVDDELSRIRRDQRTIMSFNNMPVTIKRRFDDEARRRQMGKKELFIEMMRHFGIDVPPYDLLDGRRQY